jgi:cardiolipin synthase
VIDGLWGAVGSYNLDNLSLMRNLEVAGIVMDQEFAGRMESLFEADCRNSKEVTLAEWERRGLKRRLLEQFWFLFRSFL